LAQEFGRHQVGRGYSISKEAFFNEISRFYQLSYSDQALIEQNYASPQNPREIDHVKFLEDIRSAVKDTRQRNIVYTQDQQRAIQEAKRVL
jgi:Tfp pilus assembly PilM family ATPase